MDLSGFREALLSTMEQKSHWAWPAFTSGLVPRDRLHLHLEQEYATYVRDFPVLVGRAYVACPIAEVRRELIANVYEEETGGLFAGQPHPDLFLEYPRGMGMDLARFAAVRLLPAAQAYRDSLDDATLEQGWEVAATVTTLFVEGTSHERAELASDRPHSPPPPLQEHPLVKHYGLPVEHLTLTKAHRAVEGDHRRSAWKIVLNFVPETLRGRVVFSMQQTLKAWLAYRDEVAEACGLRQDAVGQPELRS